MKRLSNKKYLLNKLLWVIVVGWAIVFALMILGCATPEKVQAKTEPTFCQLWNDGPAKGMEQPFTAAQNKMLHMGYFLSKEEFVRTTLNQQYGPGLVVDLTVTCYTENIVFLVEEVGEICKCSNEDRRERVTVAWNDYINACFREAQRQVKK